MKPAMIHRLPILIAIASLALARAALAADPAAAPVATAPSDATAAQIDAWLADDGGAASGADDAGAGTAQVPQAPGPRAIHGEASVGFGSNGYREAQVSAVIPVGQTGALGVAVGDEGFRGHDRRNLAVSLALGPGATLEPCGVRHTGVQLASDVARGARCGQDLTAP